MLSLCIGDPPGNYAQAAKTAVIIARHEQDLGNYKVAHGILYETVRQLEDHKARVPQALRASFVLLHSYMLVKMLVKREDHEGAARMLLRVAKNISRFPAHIVRILTSTVIECQRAGLKNSAYEYATMLLMNADYRGQVDAKFKRKIESIVRRPNKEEEAAEQLSPCPISKELIPLTELECPTTKDAIPMCVVTGRHMEADNWCTCPVSRMPALYTEYVKYLDFEATQGPEGACACVCPSPTHHTASRSRSPFSSRFPQSSCPFSP
jgi:WD repeat-containing protein 19